MFHTSVTLPPLSPSFFFCDCDGVGLARIKQHTPHRRTRRCSTLRCTAIARPTFFFHKGLSYLVPFCIPISSIMSCITCGESPARYRCRSCTARYCSSACFKAHRDATDGPQSCAAGKAAQAAQAAAAAKRQREEDEKDAFSDVSRAKALRPQKTTTTTTATSSTTPHAEDAGKDADPGAADPDKPSGSAAPSATLLDRDADAVYILSQRHMEAVARDKSIRQALKSAELQKLLLTIDQSRARLDALETAMYNNADFKKFCARVMAVVARVEGR